MLASDSFLNPPLDESITTLYISPVPPVVQQQEIRSLFYHMGEIKEIKFVREKSCAFIKFGRRSEAEEAARGVARGLPGPEGQNVPGQIRLSGEECKVSWAKPRAPGANTFVMNHAPAVPVPENNHELDQQKLKQIYEGGEGVSIPRPDQEINYPSQDPKQFGSAVRLGAHEKI